MALKKQKNLIPIPDQGTVPARLARVIEIGEQMTVKYGVKNQVWLFYSLPTRIIDVPESDFHGKQSMVRTAPMTMSMNEKANLVDHIKALDPTFDLDAEEAFLTPLIGKACYVTLEHNEDTQKNVTYCNIVNVMGVPEGQEVGDLDTTGFHFDYDYPDVDIWTRFISDFVKEKIQGAVNYPGSAVEEMVMRLEAMQGNSEE